MECCLFSYHFTTFQSNLLHHIRKNQFNFSLSCVYHKVCNRLLRIKRKWFWVVTIWSFYSILNRKILQSRFGLCWLEQTISLLIHFCNFVFKRLKNFVNHFWFWWYVIQQPLANIFNLLHIHSKEFFLSFAFFLQGNF